MSSNGLYERSIEIILANQTPSGAFIAGPSFSPYKYCWFRDGAFTAYSMDLVGEHESSYRFHGWAANLINQRSDQIARAVTKANRNIPLSPEDSLHTRYTADGDVASEEWPNFQLDGLGSWLWFLCEHQQLCQTPLSRDLLDAADLIADYLSALWQLPCFDSWEESPDRIHTYTLAAIYGGLKAHSRISGVEHAGTLEVIRNYIQDHCVVNDHFTKSAGVDEIDANLIGLAIPYGVSRADQDCMINTVTLIEERLGGRGGCRRYPQDSYYGGGEWVLLTAWLGWYYAELGDRTRAADALEWVERQADDKGYLPEQVHHVMNSPEFFPIWQDRWGDVAKPLLWSHAMYLILHHALERIS